MCFFIISKKETWKMMCFISSILQAVILWLLGGRPCAGLSLTGSWPLSSLCSLSWDALSHLLQKKQSVYLLTFKSADLNLNSSLDTWESHILEYEDRRKQECLVMGCARMYFMEKLNLGLDSWVGGQWIQPVFSSHIHALFSASSSWLLANLFFFFCLQCGNDSEGIK